VFLWGGGGGGDGRTLWSSDHTQEPSKAVCDMQKKRSWDLSE